MRGEANLTSPSKRICPTPIWKGFRLARCFARGSIRQPTPASAPRTVPQPVSSRSQIDLQPRPGSLPFSGANAACNCLPPQRCRYSNRVLAQCPVGLPMPPAAVCHLSAADTPTSSWSSASRLANATSVLRKGRRPKTISRRDASPRPRRRRGSLRSGAQPSSPAPFRRE